MVSEGRDGIGADMIEEDRKKEGERERGEKPINGIII